MTAVTLSRSAPFIDLMSRSPRVISCSDASPALRIVQTGTGDCLRIEDAVADTSPLVIDAAGNITSSADIVASSYRSPSVLSETVLTSVALSGPRRKLELQSWLSGTPTNWVSGGTLTANSIYCQSAIPTPGGGIMTAMQLLHAALPGAGPGEINTIHSIAALNSDLNRGADYYALVSQSSHAYATAAQTTSQGTKTGYMGGQPFPDGLNPDLYYKGEIFAGNDNVRLASGAMYFKNIIGREINALIEPGSSVFSRFGLLIVNKGTGQADKVDANIGMTASTAKIGIQFGTGVGTSTGVRPDGTLIAGQKKEWGTAPYGEQLVAGRGIDFSMFNFTSSAFMSPGFNVDNDGDVTVKSLLVAAAQVVGARRTGWTPPTGTSSRATFDTATATTADLAQRLKALIDDLTAHGLIGS